MKKGLCFLISISSIFWVTLYAQNKPIINQKEANEKETIANRLVEEDNLGDAIPIYKALISFYQTENKWNQWLQSHIKLTKTLRLNDEYPSAKKVMEHCLQTDFYKSIDDSILKAEAFHQHGVTLYQLDFYQEAKDYFLLALDLRKQQLGIDTTLLIKGYHNIGSCYSFLGTYDKALGFLDTALQLNITYGIDTVRLANSYETIAQVYIIKKQFKEAENYLFTALAYFQNIYKEEPWLLADYYENITFFYNNFNLPQKVIEFAEKRLEIYQKIEDKEVSDYYGMADTYNYLGIGYQKLEKYSEALIYYQKALNINERFAKDRAFNIAFNWNNIGLVYKKLDYFEKAIECYNKALAINSPALTNQDKSDFYYNEGKVYYELGNFEKTLEAFQEAIILILPNFNIKDIYSNPSIGEQIATDKLSLAENLWEKAKTLTALSAKENKEKNLKAAQATYALIEQLLEQIRSDFEADKSKQFLIEKARKIYEDALKNTWQLYQLTKTDSLKEKMLQLAEKSKAIILLDAVKDLEAKKVAGVSAELLQQEQQLKEAISDLEMTIAAKERTIKIESDPELLTLRQKHLDRKTDLEKVVQQMEQQNPQYFKLKNEQTLFSIATIQQELLRPNQSIIEYLLTDTMLFTFVLSKENLEVHQTPIDTLLGDWINQFRNSIYGNFEQNKAGKSTEDFNQLYFKYAHQLYEKLFMPLGDLSPQIILIPDDILGALPFDALLKHPINQGEFHQLPYLGYEHQLSYGFSIQALMGVTKSTTQGNGQWLGFAPSFASNIQMIARNARSGLSPLLHNQEEVEKIGALMNINQPAFFNLEATKEAFLENSPSYSYLHLSSHAMMNAIDPDQSFIAFTQTNQQIDSNQFLYVRELYNHSLQADMVVLSACETGIGKIYQGEGVISLARAFTYAGAKSIITTLWKVNDRTTTQLMIDFYQHLTADKPKDEALWLAKRQMIDGGLKAHPYYWAGFIPVGNMSPIVVASAWWYWVGCGILLFFAFLGYYFLNRKNRKL